MAGNKNKKTDSAEDFKKLKQKNAKLKKELGTMKKKLRNYNDLEKKVKKLEEKFMCLLCRSNTANRKTGPLITAHCECISKEHTLRMKKVIDREFAFLKSTSDDESS